MKEEQSKDTIHVHILEDTDFNNYTENGDGTTSKLFDYEQYRITESTPINVPINIITLINESISTEGNVTTVSGASKSGKTASMSFVIAGAISLDGNIIDKLQGLEVAPNKDRKAVIHIDTEQARHKHQYNLKSILKRACLNQCPEYFLSYNLRQLDIDKYTTITTGICEAASERFNGIHLIVIDGIADYITDVNDAIQSNAVVKYFEELAIKYSTPIVLIVHTNPGSDKERGHLGSQCQRKSESVLTVKTDGDNSYLEPKLLRNAGKAEIPLLQFRYDKEKNYHVSCGIRSSEQQSKDAERIQKIKIIALKVFAPPTALKYEDAIEKIMYHSQKADRTAGDMFKEMRAHQMIVQGADKYWRLKFTIDIEEVQ